MVSAVENHGADAMVVGCVLALSEAVGFLPLCANLN